LRLAGVDVEQVAAYQRGMPVFDAACHAQLNELIASHSSWIITSSEALRNLLDMVRLGPGEPGMTQILSSQLIVPHPRIAETAQALGFTRVTQTASGDEALVAAIQSGA
jgi:uroporphyrinogen-III synthase